MLSRKALGHRKYTFNEDAFDQITEESAYWIGFLLADGCIIDTDPTRNPVIALTLGVQDAGHVDSFRRFLSSTAPVKVYCQHRLGHRGARLAFASPKIVAVLASHGITPRKSFTAKLAQLADNSHAWRGVVDGNGWIGAKTIKTNIKAPIIGLCGSEAITVQFASFAKSIVPHCKARPFSKKSVWQVEFSYDIAFALIKALYGQAQTALPRKLKIARQVMADWETHRAKFPRRAWATSRWG